MSKMILLAHLPLMRMDEERIPFANGHLWRLPFEVYNELSLGAFADHERAYNSTAPVFYRADVDLDVSVFRPADHVPSSSSDLKVPSNHWAFLERLGLEFVSQFQWNLVERARAALLLAAPASAVPSSMLSVTFVRLAEPGGFQIGNQLTGVISVCGDADHEYLFLNDAAGSPLPTDEINEAARCLTIVDALGQQPELFAAMRALMGATAPTLSPTDQLVLAVRAIEALLLPDITSGLGRTFAQRLSTLLGVNDAHRDALRRVARTLYDARSSSLHGESPRSREETDAAAFQGHAQQLLAAAIRRLAERSGVTPVAEQRDALDTAGPEYATRDGELPMTSPPGLRRNERLLRLSSPVVSTSSSSADMGYKDGTVSWSPLIGLAIAHAAALSSGPDGVAILTLSGDEMVSLEERDTARDFIAQLRVSAAPASVLMTAAAGEKSQPTPERIARLLRRRDLGTVALRLAGFSEFYDPELLGTFVYTDSSRTRYPSVLRQTIETRMQRPAEQTLGADDAARAREFMSLLTEYDRTTPHPQIDQVLRLFRHGFDREFLPPVACASLLLSAVEAMMGRFRKPQELEGLVSTVVQERFPEAARWFGERGRRFRNTIAHGEWPATQEDPQPLEQLTDVLRGLIPAFVQSWLKQAHRETVTPLRSFLDSVAEGV